ncbi:MAG: S-adenosylmethionine:tRNA ribosyltransferase-isomerase [bacterium]|nr:S-adenosylmethionine:tRNA ribosyltransferase-isomerase [Candidatus Colousia faecequi]
MHEKIKDIRMEDFDYPLTDERIAKYPVNERDHSKLLLWEKGTCQEKVFYELPEILPPGDLLIYNNTKVIQARLRFHKASGAEIEIFCLEPESPKDYERVFQTTKCCEWQCLVGNSRKWKEGRLSEIVMIGSKSVEFTAERIEKLDGMSNVIRFQWDDGDITFGEMLEHFGQLPIPPYLNRETEESDKRTYQTVYSRIEGSVAAPTAGLHFTKDVLSKLVLRGITEDEVTLHVGAGTFQPVKSETIGGHPMHKETISVRKATIENIIKHLGHIVAVGTTSVRTLESLYFFGCQLLKDDNEREMIVEQWEPYDTEHSVEPAVALQSIVDYLTKHRLTSFEAETRIIIVPGYEFRIVNKLITNFHQPKSTLLLLISAFVGGDGWKNIYNFALQNDFRFLSYGDSSLLIR